MAYKRPSPAPIIEGYTNAITMTNTDGVNYYDGSKIVTTSVGTAGQVLTSQGAASAPIFTTISGSTGKSFLGFGGGREITAPGNNFFCPWTFGGFPQTNEQVPSPVTGTLSNMYLWVSSNTGIIDITLTLYINSSPTILAVTVPAGASGLYMDVIDIVSISVGDFIGFGCTTLSIGQHCFANCSVALTV